MVIEKRRRKGVLAVCICLFGVLIDEDGNHLRLLHPGIHGDYKDKNDEDDERRASIPSPILGHCILHPMKIYILNCIFWYLFPNQENNVLILYFQTLPNIFSNSKIYFESIFYKM